MLFREEIGDSLPFSKEVENGRQRQKSQRHWFPSRGHRPRSRRRRRRRRGGRRSGRWSGWSGGWGNRRRSGRRSRWTCGWRGARSYRRERLLARKLPQPPLLPDGQGVLGIRARVPLRLGEREPHGLSRPEVRGGRERPSERLGEGQGTYEGDLVRRQGRNARRLEPSPRRALLIRGSFRRRAPRRRGPSCVQQVIVVTHERV